MYVQRITGVALALFATSNSALAMRPLPLDLISAIIDQLDPNAATIGGADDLPPESAAIGLNFTPAIHNAVGACASVSKLLRQAVRLHRSSARRLVLHANLVRGEPSQSHAYRLMTSAALEAALRCVRPRMLQLHMVEVPQQLQTPLVLQLHTLHIATCYPARGEKDAHFRLDGMDVLNVNWIDLSTLERLWISEPSHEYDQLTLATRITSMHNLTHLRLSGYQRRHEDNDNLWLKALATFCPRLQHLEVISSNRSPKHGAVDEDPFKRAVTRGQIVSSKETLQWLFEGCQQLQYISSVCLTPGLLIDVLANCETRADLEVVICTDRDWRRTLASNSPHDDVERVDNQLEEGGAFVRSPGRFTGSLRFVVDFDHAIQQHARRDEDAGRALKRAAQCRQTLKQFEQQTNGRFSMTTEMEECW